MTDTDVSECAFMSKEDFLSIWFDCRLYTCTFDVLVWRKLPISWCYCVKYIRNLLFWIIGISQGSVATYVRYVGKLDKGYIANFLLNPHRKDFANRPTFAKVMPKTRVTCFLAHTVVLCIHCWTEHWSAHFTTASNCQQKGHFLLLCQLFEPVIPCLWSKPI